MHLVASLDAALSPLYRWVVLTESIVSTTYLKGY